MTNVNELDPVALRPGMVDDEGNWKPSLTTSQYSGGIPTDGDLRHDLIAADGNLRQSVYAGGQLRSGVAHPLVRRRIPNPASMAPWLNGINFVGMLDKNNFGSATYDRPADIVPDVFFYVDPINGDNDLDGSSPANAIQTMVKSTSLVNGTLVGTKCGVKVVSGSMLPGWRAFADPSPARETLYTSIDAGSFTLTNAGNGYAMYFNQGVKIQLKNIVSTEQTLFAAGTALVDDCLWEDALGYGLGFGGTVAGYAKFVECRNNTKDGLSMVNGTATGIWDNCNSHDNGTSGTSKQNRATHNDIKVVDINGKGDRALNNETALIGNSEYYGIGCSGNDVIVEGVGATYSNFFVTDNAVAYLAGCDYLGGASSDMGVSLAGRIIYRDMDLTGYTNIVGGTGSITELTGW